MSYMKLPDNTNSSETTRPTVWHSYVLQSETPFKETQHKKIYLCKPYGARRSQITGEPIPENQLCLLKIVIPPPQNASDSTITNFALARESTETQFSQEVTALARALTNAGDREYVAEIYDHGIHQDTFYFVERYYDGADLSEVINIMRTGNADKKLKLQQAGVLTDQEDISLEFILDVMTDTTKALAQLHDNNIGHADVRPSNVLLPGVLPRYTQQKKQDMHRAVLTDLGSSNQRGLTDIYQLGSFVYRAPEIIHAFMNKHKRSEIPKDIPKTPPDRWSLGVMFYEMITLNYPFGIFPPKKSVSTRAFKRARKSIFKKITSDRLAPPSELCSQDRFDRYKKPEEISQEIDTITRELLQRNRGKRMSLHKVTERLQKIRHELI